LEIMKGVPLLAWGGAGWRNDKKLHREKGGGTTARRRNKEKEQLQIQKKKKSLIQLSLKPKEEERDASAVPGLAGGKMQKEGWGKRTEKRRLIGRRLR